MLTLLGAPFPGGRRRNAGEHGHALAADDPPRHADDWEHGHALSAYSTPLLTDDWILEDRGKCFTGRRAASEWECLEAVQKAAHRAELEVVGLKRVDRGLVPFGCSYSLNSKTALFNINEAGGIEGTVGWSKRGNYRLPCLAPPHAPPQRVVLLSRGRGGSTVLATTLAAFGRSDPPKLHHGACLFTLEPLPPAIRMAIH